MFTRIRPRLTYANVVSTLALFVVLGGGAYATHTHKMGPKDIRKNAVKQKQLAPTAVDSGHINPAAVRTGKIADGAVTASKLADGVAVSGPEGPKGEQGEQGSQGPAGSDATIDGVQAGGDLAGNYPNPLIAPLAVGTAKIDDLAVTTTKIADASVGLDKLATEAGESLGASNWDVGAQACTDVFDGVDFPGVAQGDLIITSAGADNPLPAGLYLPVITAPRDGVAPLLLCNSTASTINLGSGGSFERRIVSP